jgi:hypothetical protein
MKMRRKSTSVKIDCLRVNDSKNDNHHSNKFSNTWTKKHSIPFFKCVALSGLTLFSLYKENAEQLWTLLMWYPDLRFLDELRCFKWIKLISHMLRIRLSNTKRLNEIRQKIQFDICIVAMLNFLQSGEKIENTHKLTH